MTAWKRCVKVAQPRPYSPGSEVMTLTTIRCDPAGWVVRTLISRIVTGVYAAHGAMSVASFQEYAVRSVSRSADRPA